MDITFTASTFSNPHDDRYRYEREKEEIYRQMAMQQAQQNYLGNLQNQLCGASQQAPTTPLPPAQLREPEINHHILLVHDNY